jgi:outer membrane protein assembly factor BamB
MSIAFLTLTLATTCIADDWPQILGPNRDGIVTGETLPDAMPAGGFETKWQHKAGSGFAGVSVVDGTAFLFHRSGNNEILEALAAVDGKPKWKQQFPTDFRPGFTSDGGPRCVPIVHKGRVYLFGATGGLRCLNAKSGKVIWKQDTHKTLSAPEGYFGAGSTPIIEGDRIIVNVGGRNGAAVVAFALADGTEVWRAVEDTASYSSPIAATVNGTRHLIVVSRLKASSLDPATGKVRWSFPFGKRGPTVNGANPVVFGDKLLLTASYGVGAIYGTIGDTSATKIWSDTKLLASQYATPVQIGDYLYAVDGRQDSGPGSASLICLDPARQKVLWRQKNLDYGTPLAVGNKLLVLTHTGQLIAVAANPDSYKELWRTKILNSSASGYRLPAISDGKLFVRDDSVLKCIQLAN